ncbi:MAG: hypothetical protein ACYCZY_00375 [Lacisediminihabitans sp.]
MPFSLPDVTDALLNCADRFAGGGEVQGGKGVEQQVSGGVGILAGSLRRSTGMCPFSNESHVVGAYLAAGVVIF